MTALFPPGKGGGEEVKYGGKGKGVLGVLAVRQIKLLGDFCVSPILDSEVADVSRSKTFPEALSVLHFTLGTPSAKISFQSTFQEPLFQIDK
ncbi:hypothetical protein PQG02_34045 (plasmid) [Nostoc sp. UHCC 0926]|uniref:hypothetical protein n=1 Tax=Nostoc sp. UHCC 0926 TaxID=3025190 RepID=UPI00236092B0|nr:hypothetical protein [Nostoc sp. UHCC 0926]WDD36866.1 hypothetical protein PQG02_34045 [Nostoc sp. UHCC 0926]